MTPDHTAFLALGSWRLPSYRSIANPTTKRSAQFLALAAILLLSGCGGVQSALEPAGRAAERLADLFWWMASGAILIWVAVISLAIYAIRVPAGAHGRRAAVFIIGGGAVAPTVILGGLLAYGLSLLPDLVAPPPEGSLTISVSGEQWWWRVGYPATNGGSVELANEIRLPVGEPVEFQLSAADVIHSFWIPPLGGKIDMIPGRQTRLSLEPTRTGVFRGACAEYCGTSHARMNFPVVVMAREEFDGWLQRQQQPAQAAEGALALRGQRLFVENGCSGCHTIRGTPADGVVGPDLTHVGGRLSLGAGLLPNEPDDFVRWIGQTETVKPGVHMPAFAMLPPGDLRALAMYLDGLE